MYIYIYIDTHSYRCSYKRTDKVEKENNKERTDKKHKNKL